MTVCKKLIALLLALSLIAMLLAGCSKSDPEEASEPDAAAGQSASDQQETEPQAEPVTEPATEPEPTREPQVAVKVALVRYFEEALSAFEQSLEDGIQQFAAKTGAECADYAAGGYSSEEFISAIQNAINDGYNVIVMQGFFFDLSEVNALFKQYPEVYFVCVDSGFYEESLPGNTCFLSYAFEQGGYLAGYAAVADGYRSLGFMGAFQTNTIALNGYGFVQGANDAARDLGIEDQVSVSYTYVEQFYDDDVVASVVSDLYASGVEVIFSNTMFSQSLSNAARSSGGKIIATEYGASASFDADLLLAVAQPEYPSSVCYVLEELYYGNWEAFGGSTAILSLSDGSFVGLDLGSWGFRSFTVDDYNTVCAALVSGEKQCAPLTEPPETSITVNYLDTPSD